MESSRSESAIGTPIKIDRDHRPKKGEAYYPKESARRNEEGLCVVRMQVGSQGDVLAEQLLTSSGFAALDKACLLAFFGGHFVPATIDAKPIATWANISTVWKLAGSKTRRPQQDASATPTVQKHYLLKIGPNYYPQAAIDMKQQGFCAVRIQVDEKGTAGEPVVLQSTGSATLDQACALSVREARFVPARRDGMAVAAPFEILINWQLPHRE